LAGPSTRREALSGTGRLASRRSVSIHVDAAGPLTFSDDRSGTIHEIANRP
jgi:hypothetical protein